MWGLLGHPPATTLPVTSSRQGLHGAGGQVLCSQLPNQHSPLLQALRDGENGPHF